MKQCLKIFPCFGVFAFFFLTGCASGPPPPETLPAPVITPLTALPVAQPRYDTSSFWNGDSITGEARIVIDLSRQRAFFYKGGVLVGESPVSSGRDEFPTTPGDYKILQKTINYRSGQYGDYVDATAHLIRKDVDRKVDPMPPQARFVGAPMPYFMRLYNGIGLHAGALPGYPASHGCIRMPRGMAQHFFENVQVGTPVSIIP